MKNKEIIINGIDVSECEFFTPTRVTVLGGGFKTQIYCGQMNEFSDDAFAKNSPNLHCERNNNCFFKQLQRAKYYLNKIREYELNSLDVDYDEYEQHACDSEYSPIIDFVEYGLGEKRR